MFLPYRIDVAMDGRIPQVNGFGLTDEAWLGIRFAFHQKQIHSAIQVVEIHFGKFLRFSRKDGICSATGGIQGKKVNAYFSTHLTTGASQGNQ